MRDSLEQYTRRENIRISSIPEEIDENLPCKIVSLARGMDSVMQESDINVCHRLGPARAQAQRSRTVIVRFYSRNLKRKFLVKKK